MPSSSIAGVFLLVGLGDRIGAGDKTDNKLPTLLKRYHASQLSYHKQCNHSMDGHRCAS